MPCHKPSTPQEATEFKGTRGKYRVYTGVTSMYRSGHGRGGTGQGSGIGIPSIGARRLRQPVYIAMYSQASYGGSGGNMINHSSAPLYFFDLNPSLTQVLIV